MGLAESLALPDQPRETPRPMTDGQYRLLVDAITDYAVYMLDVSGRVTTWNKGAEQIHGYGADEIRGEHFSRFYSADDRERGLPVRTLDRARSEGRYESEGWRIRKDGVRFWAHVVVDPIHDTDGQLIGFAKITRDLTERKLAQETLRRSEEQFRMLVHGVTDYAIYLLDPIGCITNWNAGAERIKGYAPGEIIGEHFSRFYTEEDRREGLPALALSRAAREGRFESEGWRVRKDGSRLWAHVVVTPIRGDTGDIIGFAKITRDTTERLRAQQALEKAREALLQSQKLEALGQLTGGVAHDFNNLLMAVLGSLELLRKRLTDDPKAVALLENAYQGAQRGASLTQRMLAFARKQELHLDSVDIEGLITGMAGLLERSLGPAIRISLRFPPGLPPARTDHNLLETALLNLALNARDAMPAGGRLRIEASLENVRAECGLDLPPGRYVRIGVVDTGTGMDQQVLERATEPFFTTKGVGKGTGLGLAMVHGLAEQSGGRLRIGSRPGRGTRVEMWLPEGGPATAAPAESQPAAYGGVQRLRVLAVYDDPLVLENARALLEDLGHSVIPARSAREALALLRAGEGDLMLTDHAMPDMNGLELARTARRLRPDLPIILATGYAEIPPEETASIPLRLSKPYTQADLARVLAEAATPSPVSGQTATPSGSR